MTDNRATELLDGLRHVGGLHEFAELFGFDWDDDSDWTWHDVAVKMADDFEQAIAATLGSERGTCHAESDLSEWVCSKCQCWIPLGLTPENIMHASEWRYCPHCGARVEAVKR